MAQLMLLILELIVVCSVVVSARKQSPLRDEAGTRPLRAAECQFGKQLYEIGAVWFADLGPPFGVMYCIKCECVRIQKKRRSVAKVQCRNIKSECPVPTCDEPVLQPGRCCKACPDDLDSPDLPKDMPQQEEEEKNMKHFAALLTARTSLVLRRDDAGLAATSPHNNYVASARFTFHRKNLYYSFYVTEYAGRPRALQFVDYDGNILEEQSLQTSSTYQNATGKVCGVWRRVPREYRRLLREERLYVWLVWSNGEQQDLSLSGQVARYRSLSTELFSALLEPSIGSNFIAMKGAGGTAIVSASSSAPSIHISLVFNGVFSPEDTFDVPLTVKLEAPDKQQVVLEEVVRVQKPIHEINVVEVQSTVSASNLRQLTKGRLVLSISSKRRPDDLKLEGRVTTRAACELFQSPLSSADSDNEDRPSTNQVRTPVSGLAWLYLNRDGALVYNVKVDDLPTGSVPLLTLMSGRGRRHVELEDLTPSFQSGWANGTLETLSPKELEQLYAGDLAINVATDNERSLVRGRLVERPVADARDSPAPVLLKRPDVTSPASLVGMAWSAVDAECTLHYEVVLSGLSPEDRSLQLHLESLPFIAPGAPSSKRMLEEFQGSQLEGFLMGLDQIELSRIESGVNFLEVSDSVTGVPLLRARMGKIQIPTNCLPHYTDNDVPAMSSHSEGMPENSPCFHETRFYEEGVQWTSSLDVCAMCHCHRGRVKCDAVICPPLSCGVADLNKPLPGECCPSCNSPGTTQESNRSAAQGCYMAGQFHHAGSSWHPYLPPNGFDTCTICTCNPSNLEVQCPRTQCPPLRCSEKEAFRPDKKACCKQCPVAPASTVGTEEGNIGGVQRDQQDASVTQKTVEDILAEGGCKYPVSGPYENGKEWHPHVSSHGEVKCVKCRCKDGKVRCERKRCLRSTCGPTMSVSSGRRRQHLDGGDECCSQCKRSRRHQRPPVNS